MKETIDKPKILFISGDPFVNDLEWKLPLIINYAKLRYEVHVFAIYRSKKAGRNLFLWILHENNIKVFYREDLWFLEPLPKRVYELFVSKSSSLLVRLISKLYFSETHSLSKILLLQAFRKKAISEKVKKLMINYGPIYLCQFPNIHVSIVLQSFQLLKSKSPNKLIGLPDAAHVFWMEDKICDYDLLLLNTVYEADAFKKISKTPFAVTGSPHFNFKWQESVIQQYENYNNQEKQLPQLKVIILVLLVKPGHVHWKSISHNDVVTRLLKSISKPNTHLLVKPHPRANIDELHTLLKNIGLSSYQIVMDNVGYWADRSDKVVSLLTYSCLSALAVKKVPYIYWPIGNKYEEFLNDGGNPDLKRLFLRQDSEGKYSSIFGKYCVDVFDVNFNFPSLDEDFVERKLLNFKTDFKIDSDIPKMIDEIHDRLEMCPS